MKYDLKMKRKDESGAIMLEIIAVLALMGVMGAMLFRQINHRNQELHNIQMASEIRVAKEAFSAWIQSNLAVLRRGCGVPGNKGDVMQCGYSSDDIVSDIRSAGFFPDGYGQLGNDYYFELFVYWRGTGWDAAPAYYGVVLPKQNILPDGGEETSSWNFKRAARVAMLIGGDGGVYDPTITRDEANRSVMSGTAGAWTLDVTGGGVDLHELSNIPVYGAITGFDVYQPEVEVEDSKVNLPDSWDLVTHNFGAYGAFAIGMKDNNCYEIHHDEANNIGGTTINSDTVHTPTTNRACEAVLWVDGPDSKVYVNKGVEVGYDLDAGTSAVSIEGEKSQDGQIVISDEHGRASIILDGSNSASSATAANTLTIKDGVIMTNKSTGVVGTSGNEAEYRYKLDPANTSVVYDIRLGALGGMKLSELLPDVILKDVGQIVNSNTTVSKPPCPTGYSPAILLVPGRSRPTLSTDATVIAEDEYGDDNKLLVNVTVAHSGGSPTVTKTYKNLVRPTLQINSNKALYEKDGANETGNWNIIFNTTSIWRVGWQTYCVKPTITVDTKNAGNRDVEELKSNYWTVNKCAEIGLGYNSSTGKCTTALSSGDISNITDAAVCRNAGYVWSIKDQRCSDQKPSAAQNEG